MPSRAQTSTDRHDSAVDRATDALGAEETADPSALSDNVDGSTKVKAAKKKPKAKRRGRPGQVDPQAAPRVGSSPYPGLPYPLGATPYQGGTNFAVVADGVPGVSDVQLCLIAADGTEQRLPMDERTYGIWHTFVPDVGAGQIYGFRVPARDPDPRRWKCER